MRNSFTLTAFTDNHRPDKGLPSNKTLGQNIRNILVSATPFDNNLCEKQVKAMYEAI